MQYGTCNKLSYSLIIYWQYLQTSSTDTAEYAPLRNLPPSRMAQPSTRAPGPTLFHFLYERQPRPLNVATPPGVRSAATSPYHPFHVKMRRVLAAFDPARLHIGVGVPTALSRSGCVRNRVVKRVRNALLEELQAKGWNWDGTVRGEKARECDGEGEGEESKGAGRWRSGDTASFELSGAYKVVLSAAPMIIHASYAALREDCGRMVRKMVENQVETKRRANGTGRVEKDWG